MLQDIAIKIKHDIAIKHGIKKLHDFNFTLKILPDIASEMLHDIAIIMLHDIAFKMLHGIALKCCMVLH